MERRRGPAVPMPFGRRQRDRPPLTERQRQVLDLVAEGLENKEIAGRLGISEQGVKQQVSVLLRKFEAPSRAMLTRAAITMRLVGSRSGTDVPYAYLFDRAPLLLAISRGPDHEFVLVNRAYAAAFGDRGYVGRTVRECFPELPEDVHAALDHTYASGEGDQAVEQRRDLRLADGTVRTIFLTYVREAIRDPGGGVTGLAFYGWDTTADVQRRRRLERLTSDQQRLLDQLPIGVAYFGADGRVHYTNRTATRLLGAALDPSRSAEQLAADWDARFADGAPIASLTNPASRALQGWPYDGEVSVRRKDGLRVPLRISVRPLTDDEGRVTGAVIAAWERDGPLPPPSGRRAAR